MGRGTGGEWRNGGPDLERELSEELRFHIRARAEEIAREGVPFDEALRRAENEFGNLEATLRYCASEDRRRLRRRRAGRVVRALADDASLAFRALVRRPRAVLAPAVILATGVALNALVFTVVRGVLLSPPPFAEPERLVVVEESRGEYGVSRVSYPVLDAWREAARSVDALASYTESELVLMVGAEPRRVRAAAVTEGYFDLLDRPFLVGRPLPPEAHDPSAPASAVISERLWRSAFAADPEITDRTLRIDGREVPVLGVVRGGAVFPDETDVWTALEPGHPDLLEMAGARILMTFARLRPGAGIDDATRELGALAATVQGGSDAVALEPLEARILGDVRRPLLLLQGAVLLVLLAAAANAGSMLLARGVRRRAELAVRASVGAGRGRITTSLLLEGLWVGVGAGVCGVLVAALALEPALALVPDDLPRAQAISLDPLVVGVALALAALTGLATALVPALTGARTQPLTLLHEAGPGRGESPWLRRSLEGLVVGQIALAVLLTAGAGLLVRSLVTTLGEDPGFDPSQVTVLDVTLPEYRYPDASSRLAFARELLSRAEGLPGVTAVALGRNLPISGSNMTSPLALEGGSQTTPVQIALVSAGYFDVLRIPLVEGAAFGDTDREGGPPVLVVNEGVRSPDGGALGVGARARSYFGMSPLRDVIGVAGAVRHDGLRAAPAPVAYEPFFQKGGASDFALLIRSDAPAATVAAEARRLLGSMDSELPLDRVGTMAARLARSVAGPRFYAVVLGLFGGVAVALALAGCHAGLAHRVASRRRELGLRIALGASGAGVRRMVLARGLALTAAGAALGLLAALPLTALLESQLYGVERSDPTTYTGLLVLLLAAAALASDLPARRAAAVDPTVALKE